MNRFSPLLPRIGALNKALILVLPIVCAPPLAAQTNNDYKTLRHPSLSVSKSRKKSVEFCN